MKWCAPGTAGNRDRCPILAGTTVTPDARLRAATSAHGVPSALPSHPWRLDLACRVVGSSAGPPPPVPQRPVQQPPKCAPPTATAASRHVAIHRPIGPPAEVCSGLD